MYGIILGLPFGSSHLPWESQGPSRMVESTLLAQVNLGGSPGTRVPWCLCREQSWGSSPGACLATLIALLWSLLMPGLTLGPGAAQHQFPSTSQHLGLVAPFILLTPYMESLLLDD